ncbi:DUF3349 domain-containing protein [Streptomyces sp. NP160]|uniref:DUF3349 domain-containing protein n=1 Tax=Streptomyces sp. NP160 TaxID=2586637 RepID=UPI001117E222|nr:DUF3349 domain-containing protein [Streptomyces sp. NP160]TNM59776.1 DUF3349 domain-containing protein [Streptomyces sp. NP160]
MSQAPRAGVTARVLGWLRAGYPAGVPQGDYVALLGLLRRGLTDTEVRRIAAELAAAARHGDDITTADVERLIGSATLDQAAPEDVARVCARLAAGGWPLAQHPEDPEHPEHPEHP